MAILESILNISTTHLASCSVVHSRSDTFCFRDHFMNSLKTTDVKVISLLFRYQLTIAVSVMTEKCTISGCAQWPYFSSGIPVPKTTPSPHLTEQPIPFLGATAPPSRPIKQALTPSLSERTAELRLSSNDIVVHIAEQCLFRTTGVWSKSLHCCSLFSSFAVVRNPQNRYCGKRVLFFDEQYSTSGWRTRTAVVSCMYSESESTEPTTHVGYRAA